MKDQIICKITILSSHALPEKYGRFRSKNASPEIIRVKVCNRRRTDKQKNSLTPYTGVCGFFFSYICYLPTCFARRGISLHTAPGDQGSNPHGGYKNSAFNKKLAHHYSYPVYFFYTHLGYSFNFTVACHSKSWGAYLRLAKILLFNHPM